MYIRVTRVQTQPAAAPAAIDNFKQVILPRTRSAPGNLGGVLLVNRESGSAAGITFWESARAMALAEQLAIEVRAQSVDKVPATRILNVERFEIRIMERTAPPEPGVSVRFNTLSGDPEKTDALTVFVRNSVLPVVKAQPGFRTMVHGVDRQTGRSTVTTVWTSLDALKQSEDRVAGLRAEAARVAGASAEQVTVELFEAAVVDLVGEAAAVRTTA